MAADAFSGRGLSRGLLRRLFFSRRFRRYALRRILYSRAFWRFILRVGLWRFVYRRLSAPLRKRLRGG